MDADVLAFYALARSASPSTDALQAALSAGAGVSDLLRRGLVPPGARDFLQAVLAACSSIESATALTQGGSPAVVEEARVEAATRLFALVSAKELESRRAEPQRGAQAAVLCAACWRRPQAAPASSPGQGPSHASRACPALRATA